MEAEELHRRQIKAVVFCVACGREETLDHWFWPCVHSALYWKFSCSKKGVSVAILPVSVNSQSALSSYLLAWFVDGCD